MSRWDDGRAFLDRLAADPLNPELTRQFGVEVVPAEPSVESATHPNHEALSTGKRRPFSCGRPHPQEFCICRMCTEGRQEEAEPCWSCSGRGMKGAHACQDCGGTGRRDDREDDPLASPEDVR
jgi:hypothetical protein